MQRSVRRECNICSRECGQEGIMSSFSSFRLCQVLNGTSMSEFGKKCIAQVSLLGTLVRMAAWSWDLRHSAHLDHGLPRRAHAHVQGPKSRVLVSCRAVSRAHNARDIQMLPGQRCHGPGQQATWLNLAPLWLFSACLRKFSQMLTDLVGARTYF